MRRRETGLVSFLAIRMYLEVVCVTILLLYFGGDVFEYRLSSRLSSLRLSVGLVRLYMRMLMQHLKIDQNLFCIRPKLP
jgi:hypothetical protein